VHRRSDKPSAFLHVLAEYARIARPRIPHARGMEFRHLTGLVGSADIGVLYAMALCGLWLACGVRRVPRTSWLLAPIVAGPVAAMALLVSLGGSLLTLTALSRDARATDSLAAAVVAAVAGFCTGLSRARGVARERYVRGARVARGPGWCRSALVRRRAGLQLAGAPIDPSDETRHFKIIGTTGTGKTTAILALLHEAVARGDAVVVSDPDSGYARELYDGVRGDVILNPFDPRSSRWDPFAECSGAPDADHLARALIPDQPGEDRSWRGYARVLCAALIRRLLQAEPGQRSALHRLLVSAPAEELAVLLADSAAAAYLSRDNARFLASVRAIAATHLAIFEFLAEPVGAASISVRAWIREAAHRPACLFLPYSATQIATLRAAISAWMRLAIFETMETPGTGRRVWFVVDELDALGPIDGLKDALVRLRKFGGRCVLGLQSIGQVTGSYGRFDAQTIVENCANTLILRCSSGGPDGTSQFASRLIGEREVLREQLSRTRQGRLPCSSAAQTTVLQRATEHAVLAAEIEQLPDFAGFLKLASRPEWQRIDGDAWRP